MVLPQVSQDDIDVGSVKSTATASARCPLGDVSDKESPEAQRLERVTGITIGEMLFFCHTHVHAIIDSWRPYQKRGILTA